MTTKYPRIYAALKTRGLSPAKALEIMYDAKRGGVLAMRWIRITMAARKVA